MNPLTHVVAGVLIVAGTSNVLTGQATSELSGVIQDSAKAPINGARISIWEPETTTRMETTSTAGRYTFANIPEGNYLLKAEKDGMALLFAAVRLIGSGHHDLNLAMVENRSGNEIAVKAEPATLQKPKTSSRSPGTTPSPPSRIHTGSAIQARLLHQVAPVLPNTVKVGLKSGVNVAAIIRTDGWMDDIVVLHAPDPEFALATLMAVRQWRYSPTLVNGEPVEVMTTVSVSFHAQ